MLLRYPVSMRIPGGKSLRNGGSQMVTVLLLLDIAKRSAATWKLENFESKLRKKKIEGYFNKYLGESLTEDFLSPPSLEEMPESVIKNKTEYSKDNADLITDFSPLSFKLEIDSGSFDVDISATFAAGKNKKIVKKLA